MSHVSQMRLRYISPYAVWALSKGLLVNASYGSLAHTLFRNPEKPAGASFSLVATPFELREDGRDPALIGYP